MKKVILNALSYLKTFGFVAFINKVLHISAVAIFGRREHHILSMLIIKHQKEINYYNERYIKLANAVGYVYGCGVRGDIAEFGTMTGRTAVVLATAIAINQRKYILDSRNNKKLFLFDSFEGLPEARFEVDRETDLVSSNIWGKGSCSGMNEVELDCLIAKYLDQERFSIIKGWFKNTVPEIPTNSKFSLIHIDGDLYESAIDVLDNMFAKKLIANGAMILFDDWNCNAANPKYGERKAWSEVIEKYFIEYSDAGSYGDCCHSFIVHSYK
jgi:hypothetical protein